MLNRARQFVAHGIFTLVLLYASHAGAQIVNGGVVSGFISSAGEQDSYTFSATAGEYIQLRVADTSGGDLYPLVKLFSPSGEYLTFGGGYEVAAIDRPLTVSGTYTVVIADGTSGHAQTGTYQLHFAKAPGANELGALLNGGSRTESISLGDLDSYTFTANAGEYVQLRVADLSDNDFYPLIGKSPQR